MKTFSFVVFCIVLVLLTTHPGYPQAFTSSNLPIIVVTTQGGVPVPDSGKIIADMGIIFNGEGVRNYLTDPFNNYNGKIGIEIRGSTSQMFDKKSYSVETRTAANEDTSVSLLGFPGENDWVLYAPYNDKSLLRDVIIYKLSNEMGHYASRSKFCEMVLNGQYIGIYVLLEKIKRDQNRVNIANLQPTDSTGDELTGGYIIKIDKTDGENNGGWYSQNLPFPGAWQSILYQYHYPKPDDITFLQRSYIKEFIYVFENIMNSPQFSDTATGYPHYIDVNSFADYFLLNEFAKNVDSYRLSMYMHKDKDSNYPKMVIGPVWDYNISLGNCDYYNAGYPEGWHIEFTMSDTYFLQNDPFQMPFWWKKLYYNDLFRNTVFRRWQETKETVFNKTAIFNYIDSCAAVLTEARIRNFQKWQILGTWVWPNLYVFQTYAEEVAYLKQFIENRLFFLSNNMIGTSAGEPENIPSEFALYQNYPNPFNPSTKIRCSIKQEGYITLKIYDITGSEIKTLVNEYKPAGIFDTEFNAGTFPSGVYFCRLQQGEQSEIIKMTLLK